MMPSAPKPVRYGVFLTSTNQVSVQARDEQSGYVYVDLTFAPRDAQKCAESMLQAAQLALQGTGDARQAEGTLVVN